MTNVNIQEHKSAANNDHHKREEDVIHNQPRVRDNRSNPNNSEFDRGRTRPLQRPEQVNKINEGQITNAAPIRYVRSARDRGLCLKPGNEGCEVSIYYSLKDTGSMPTLHPGVFPGQPGFLPSHHFTLLRHLTCY